MQDLSHAALRGRQRQIVTLYEVASPGQTRAEWPAWPAACAPL